MENMNQRQLKNEREAADYLNVKPQTMAVWRCNGNGPKFVKLNRAVRYRLSDIEAWLESRTATCATH